MDGSIIIIKKFEMIKILVNCEYILREIKQLI